MLHTKLQEFIALIRTNNCETVVVEPYIRMKGFWRNLRELILSFDPMMPSIVDGPCEYVVKAASITLAGRKLCYEEVCFEGVIDYYGGFPPQEEEDRIEVKHYLMADAIVKDIKRNLPEIRVHLISQYMGAMDEKMYKKLYDDARKYKLLTI